MKKELCKKLVASLFLVVSCSVSVKAAYAAYVLGTDVELFNAINLDYTGMGAVKSAVNAGNYTLAKSELLKYYQTRPAYSASTPYGRSYWPLATTGNVAQADDNSNHYFTFWGMRGFAGTNINWFNNPFSDPQWLYFLQRHGWIPNFGRVYVQTSNEKYALEWIAEIRDYTTDCTVDRIDGLDSASRTLAWVESYQYFINQYDSPSITPDDNALLLKAIKEQADYLTTIDKPGNHGLVEKYAQLMVAVMFPEFKSANAWLNDATVKLEGHLNADFLADGVQYEMSPGYHAFELTFYFPSNELTQMNNIYPFSSNYMTKLEKACEFMMYINKPSQYTPALSDTSRNTKGNYFVKKGADVFGRQDMLYVYTSGVSGTVPTEISKSYPNAKYTIMRSGWGTASNFNQQLYLVFDSGPLGGGHGHFDWLNFEAYGYGKDLIVDPGRYTYDATIINGINWRKYFRITKAHNTIVVDNTDQVTYIGTWGFGPLPTYGIKDWVTNNGFDFVHGWVQSQNYPVKHDRKIFFVRNEYWIISDLLTSTNTVNSHTYDQYFHIPKDGWGETTMDATTKVVTCTGNNLKIIPADPTTFTSASIINDWDETGYGGKTESPTAKYTKTGVAPKTFDTVIYPYPTTAPAITLTRLAVDRSGTPVTTDKASGLKIDIGSNNDYYFIAHDTSTTTTYNYDTYQLNGVIGYIRKDGSGNILNIQVNDGVELKDNGILIARTDKRSHVSSKGGVVEIWGVGGVNITSYQVWCPAATSVKINGVSVSFTQSGNYVLGVVNPPSALTGDLNLDDKVNIQDIQLCVKVILGTETTPAIIQRAKEVAEPLDKADIKDIQEIVKFFISGGG